MSTINQYKEQTAPPTPLFIFDCLLASGNTERWSTHAVTVGGNVYAARLLKHNLAALVASSDEGLDGRKRFPSHWLTRIRTFRRSNGRRGFAVVR